MNESRVRQIYERIQKAAQHWDKPTVPYFQGQPFKALIASMLSAQTREEHTMQAAQTLFTLADSPAEMARLSREQIAEAIAPVTYFEKKIDYVLDIAGKVAANDGIVPQTVDELIAYKGVGWKVAVLTLAVGYGIHDEITVDTHVARISKRLGWVDENVKQPKRISEVLLTVLPRDLWPYWNPLMVQFGRNMCYPRYPNCRRCPVNDLCPKIGVR